MTDDEIEEKLRTLSPTQLSGLVGNLLRGDLTDQQRQELLEIQTETKQRERAVKHLLREKGPQMLKLMEKSLREDNLTTAERQQLERTVAMLAGYQMSFWLPKYMIGKVLMFLFLAVGVIGVFQWSPWFGLFILLACSSSPRIVGEVLHFIGKISK